MDSKTYQAHLADIPQIYDWLGIEDIVANQLVEFLPDLDIESATKRVVSDLFLNSCIGVRIETEYSQIKTLVFEIANNVPTSGDIRYHYFVIYSKPDLNNIKEEDIIIPVLRPLVTALSSKDIELRKDTLDSILHSRDQTLEDFVNDGDKNGWDFLQIISIRKPTEMRVWNDFLTIVSKNTAYGIMYIPGVLVSNDDTDFHERFYIQESNLDFPGYVAQYLTDNFNDKFILADVYEEFTKLVNEQEADDYLQKSLMSLEEQVTTVDKVIDIQKTEETTSPKWKQIMKDTCTVIGNSDNKYLKDHFTRTIDIFEKIRESCTAYDDSIVEDFYLSMYRAFSHLDSIKSTCTDCKCGDKGTLVSSTVESTTEDIKVSKDNKEIHIHIHL